MKTRIVYSLIVIVAIVGLFVFIRNRNAHESVDANAERAITNSNTEPINGRTNQPHASGSNSSEMAARDQASQERKEALAAALSEYSKMTPQPIEFYGVVLDESNSPIAGADVSFGYNQYNPANSSTSQAVSDQNGCFSLSGVKGIDLEVRVYKNGYYPLGSNPYHFVYLAPPASEPFHPDAGNPVVFRLRKKGPGVNLITSNYGVHRDLDVSAPLDGTPVRVDLLNRQVAQNGQIEISQVKPDPKNWKEATEWKLQITIPDGGFVSQADEFPFEAPDTGYQSTIQFDFKQGDSDWTTSLSTNFYIEFGNPPVYGRLTVEDGLTYGPVTLNYAINPDGSRNLEPK
jgi:hypothetical protein